MDEKKARAKLGTSTRRRLYPGCASWMAEHPESLAFVRMWMDMKAKGKSDWSLNQLHTELRKSYAFPYKSVTSVLKWLQDEHANAYRKAMEVRTS